MKLNVKAKSLFSFRKYHYSVIFKINHKVFVSNVAFF